MLMLHCLLKVVQIKRFNGLHYFIYKINNSKNVDVIKLRK